MRNCILTVLLTGSISLSAQNHFIGVKGGYGWTTTSAAFLDPEPQQNNSFGVVYDFAMRNKTILGAELLFEQRGFDSGLIFGDILKLHYDYHYVTLPLKVGYSLGEKFFAFGNIGVIPAILIKAETDMLVYNQALRFDDSTVTITDRISKFDFGGLAEIGIGIKAGKRLCISSALRYQQSFTTLTTDKYYSSHRITSSGVFLNFIFKYNIFQ
jgi:hypothetical protein